MRTHPGDFNPFPTAHCSVVAWSHLAGQGRNKDYMLTLAARMKRLGKVSGIRLLNAYGTARLLIEAHVETWAKEVGVRVTEKHSWYKVKDLGKNRRGERIGVAVSVPGFTPTLKQFVRQYGRGARWLAITTDHALAVVNGKPRGDYSNRSYVIRAYRIEGDPAVRVRRPRARTD